MDKQADVVSRDLNSYLSWRVDDPNVVTKQEGIAKYTDEHAESQPECVSDFWLWLKKKEEKIITIVSYNMYVFVFVSPNFNDKIIRRLKDSVKLINLVNLEAYMGQHKRFLYLLL